MTKKEPLPILHFTRHFSYTLCPILRALPLKETRDSCSQFFQKEIINKKNGFLNLYLFDYLQKCKVCLIYSNYHSISIYKSKTIHTLIQNNPNLKQKQKLIQVTTMSQGYSVRRSEIGSLGSVSNYGDYRYNREEQENDFHSVSKIYNEKIIRNIESQKKMNMLYNYQVKNNEYVPEKDLNKKEEKVRKTRKDKQGRKFICGACGLGYLSYPALYTHIKTKHDGEIPEGTIRGENGKAKKRGRPKNRKTPILGELEQQKNTFPQQLLKVVKKQHLKILQEFSFDVDNESDDQNGNNLQTKYFVGMLKQLKKQQKPVLKLMKISKLMTVFLYNCKDFFDKDALLSFEQTFCELVVYCNDNYINLLKEYQMQSDLYVEIDDTYPDFRQQRLLSEYQKNYTSCESPEFLPYFVEKFIRENVTSQDEEEKKLILIDFCNWLYQNKLTSLKLEKNKAEALV